MPPFPRGSTSWPWCPSSEWEIRLDGVDFDRAGEAVRALLAEERLEVQRMTKKGLRTSDCRAAVTHLTVAVAPADHQACAILNVVVRHGTPSVRPDDVLAGLRNVAGLEPTVPLVANCVAQSLLDAQTGTVGDSFASDRDAS